MLENKLIINQDEEENEEKKDEGSLTDKMLQTRTILISEGVTSKSASKFINNLLLLEQEDPEKEITVLINSPGGEIYSGLAMYDMMNFVSCPIKTVVVGLAASMGSILLLAGEDGKRFALPNSKVLIHQPLLSGVYQGRATELEIQANEMLKLRKHLNGIIADKTGQNIEKVEKDTERDNWLDANESLEYNLVSKIITTKKEMV